MTESTEKEKDPAVQPVHAEPLKHSHGSACDHDHSHVILGPSTKECGHDHSHHNPGLIHESHDQHEHPTLDKPDPVDMGQDKAILSLDNLGIFASIACLIHCLAMPVLIAAVPFIGINLSFLEEAWVENCLIAAIVAFAVFAIVPGYFRHKKPIALIGLIIGLLMVMTVAFGRDTIVKEDTELPLIAFGNLFLVVTHLLNRRFTTGSFLGHVHSGAPGDHSSCDHKH